MNIYALRGHKVRCKNLTGGYDSEEDLAKRHLEIGKEYTIEKTVVDNWSTDVWLEEIPDIRFNSVFFEDAEEQSEEKTQQHPDFIRYRRMFNGLDKKS